MSKTTNILDEKMLGTKIIFEESLNLISRTASTLGRKLGFGGSLGFRFRWIRWLVQEARLPGGLR